MEWLVRLQGREDDIKELSGFVNIPEACVIQDGQVFALRSDDFNSLKSADDVLKKAEEIVSRINGAAFIATGMRKPMATEHVIRINDDSTRHVFARFGNTMQIRASLSISIKQEDGTIHEQHFAEPVAEWLDIANRDEKVAKVLRLFGSGVLDWVNLYRIYEVILSDAGNTLVSLGWATKKSVDRFTRTANSPSAIGDAARHGRESTQPPPNPMALSEARSLIESIFHNWVRTKT